MKPHKASIALISLLVISAVSLILVVAASVNGLSNYEQSFNFEAGKSGYYGAEACLEEALLRMEGDSAFAGTSITLDAESDCTVVLSGTSPKTITVTVNFLDYTQTFQATAQVTQSGQIINTELLTWKEI
ncbi:MAG: hypothetical protein AAB383_06800 [Patescibacteria group bacterium]